MGDNAVNVSRGNGEGEEVAIAGDAVADNPADLSRANGEGEELVASVDNRIGAVANNDVADVIIKKRRCVTKKRICVFKGRVKKLETELAQSAKKAEQYRKLILEKETVNEGLGRKLVHLLQLIWTKGNIQLVTLVKKEFPGDFAEVQEKAEQEKRNFSAPVSGNGNRLASGVKRKAPEDKPDVGVIDGGSNMKKMRRDTAQISDYDGEATVEVDDGEAVTGSAEVEIVGQSVGVVGHANEGERSLPNVNVTGEELLTEDDGATQSDVESMVARYSEILKDGQVKCRDCRQVVGLPSSMFWHVVLHLKGGPYPCDKCGKKLWTISSLRLHRNRTCSGPATCHSCGKICKSKGMLSTHKKVVHKGGRK